MCSLHSSDLYESHLNSLPSVILSLEQGTQYLSDLAVPLNEDSVFPTVMLSSPDTTEKSPHFTHDVNDCITKIISLENSMINILEDLMLYAESKWNFVPDESSEDNLVDLKDSDSQLSLDEMPTTSLQSSSKHKSTFLKLIDTLKQQKENRMQLGIKIHEFLQLNSHLECVQQFYQLVSILRDTNEEYTRSNGFSLSKENASILLEEGEKLESFHQRVIDKVGQYQKAMQEMNHVLGLM